MTSGGRRCGRLRGVLFSLNPSCFYSFYWDECSGWSPAWLFVVFRVQDT